MELTLVYQGKSRTIQCSERFRELLRPRKGLRYRVEFVEFTQTPFRVKALWHGNDAYEVSIDTEGRVIKSWSCTCPAAQYILSTGNPVRGWHACKHVIATVHLVSGIYDLVAHWTHQLETGERVCENCRFEETPGLCSSCGGTGRDGEARCEDCMGSGLCETCNGSGYVGGGEG